MSSSAAPTNADEAEAPVRNGSADSRDGSYANGRVNAPELLPDSAPLSFSQQRLWFLDRLHPGSPAYNIPVALRLQGTLNASALQRAITVIAERHEVLRARFQEVDGEPWQDLWPVSALEIPVIDLSAEREQTEALLRQHLEREARRPFDLSGEMLFRAKLFRPSPNEHVLFVNMHHSVSDATSLSIFFNELSSLYQGFLAGRPALLEPLPIQYTDYAVWQREQANPQELKTHVEFWKNELAGVPAVLELPLDSPRPQTSHLRGARVVREIPAELVLALQPLSRKEGLSPFMLYLAAFGTLMFRLTEQPDFVVAIPVTGREQLETEPLIGFFSNTLPLRLRPDGSFSFRKFLQLTRDAILRLYEHQEVPLEKLIEELGVERRSNQAPLVQVLFTVEPGLAESIALPGLETSLEMVDSGTAKADLTFTVCLSKRRASVELQYNSDIFEPGTVKRWLGHFETLLAGIAANADSSLAELPLLSAKEVHQLVVEWNDTRAEYPRNAAVHELFEEQTRNTPGAVALVSSAGKITYAELNVRANRLARYLRSKGLTPGRVGCICLERSPEVIVALLAILKAGGCYAALDPSLPVERCRELLQQLQAAVLITRNIHLKPFAALPRKLLPTLICVDRESRSIAGEDGENLGVACGPESPVYICFTSGSTGRPKGVCVPHRGVVRLVRNANYVRFSEREVFLQAAPVSFDASTFEIWGALLNGGGVAVAPPGLLSISQTGDAIKRFSVTTAWFTAGLFNQIVEENVAILKPLHQILVGGEALSPAHIKKARLLLSSATLVNGYGPTENTTFSACYTIPSAIDERRSLPIGKPISNSSCYVLDELLKPVPVGVAGNLFVGGDGLAIGYLDQPELTAERFIQNPFQPGSRLYRTGDRARYLPDGNLEFLGRKDNQVKVRGFRVELGEIEAALLRHPAVRHCAVVARAGSSGINQITAYLVARPHLSSAVDWRQYLAQILPDYMVPAGFVILESIPLSPNGKVNRDALPQPELPARPAQDERPAKNETERGLQQIWADVLKTRQVGLRQNFFSLGGHSLLAVRLVARIEKQFNKSLAVATLFQNPTVEQLAKAIDKGENAATEHALVPIQPDGTLPPIIFVHGAGGGILWGYANLARCLGPDQPVFALQPAALDETNENQTIEQLAASHLACLREFQPHGPYYLGGYCFGGVVAYEMARQLREAREEIGFLAAINSNPPNSSYTHPRLTAAFPLKFARNAAWRICDALQSPRKWYQHLSLKAQTRLRFFRRRFSDSAAAISIADQWIEALEVSDEERPLWRAHTRALLQYRPRPYPGRLTLFRSPGHAWFCSFDNAFGWAELAEGGVTVKIVPGAHETILKSPNVELLAKELHDCLAVARTIAPLGEAAQD
jgi:amino acid adenylation domain-containing protein